MIHTVKDFSIVNEAVVNVFLELSCFFDDPTDVGNLISGSSAFSKTSLNVWEFLAQLLLKPSLVTFEHYFASMWEQCNCAVVWTFFGIGLSLGMERKLNFFWAVATAEFSKCAGIISAAFSQHHLLGFEIAQLEFHHILVVMLSKAHLTSHSMMSGSRWVVTPLWFSGSWRSFFFVQLFCVFLPPLLSIFCLC